jgi:hypothetical protein
MSQTSTWYQIHTNGGTTTFARIYQGQDDKGYGCWWFEKMSVEEIRDSDFVWARWARYGSA